MDKRIIRSYFFLPQGRGIVLELDKPLETLSWTHAYVDGKEYKFSFTHFFDWITIFCADENFDGKELVLTA